MKLFSAKSPFQPPSPPVVSGGEPEPSWPVRLLRAMRARPLVVGGIGVGLALLVAAGVVLAGHLAKSPAEAAKKQTTAQKDAPKSADQTKNDTPTASQTNSTANKSTSKKSGGNSGGSGTSGGSSGGSSGSCALPSYPSASCTGVPAGTKLTIVNGDQTYATPNAVIDAKDIRGCVTVTAPGVVIKRSKISADCFYVVYSHQTSGTRLTIQDSEIDCQNHNGTAIGDTSITALRVNVHGCENGFDIDATFTVQDSYIHDLTQTGADPHTDGMQLNPNAHDISIIHNTIYAFTGGVNGTSAIIEPSTDLTNVLIQYNLVAGGAYTIYCRATGHYGNTWHLKDNHFSTINGSKVGEYGPWTDCQDENISGNVYHESGQAVAPQ